jgi:hypothetical protein
MVSGEPAVVYGNMPNRGAIANLPADAIAEAPTLVDRTGLRFTTVGELPPQLVGYMQPHITQHALFIRAVLERRRDHIYQAAMFDPLTAATMPLDKIVEMCDELIAAHGMIRDGGVLPDLDGKRTLVPTSGKNFGPIKSAELREKWCAQRGKGFEEYVKQWYVIGPFPAGHENRRGLDLPTPVEDDVLGGLAGAIDSQASYRMGDHTFQWRSATADDRGFVDLDLAAGRMEWAVAYAYAEVNSLHDREVVLRFGSDDGIKVWLNGHLIHTHEVGRGFRPDADLAPAHLNAGTNRIFVKIDNYSGGWGFGVAVPKPGS